MELKIVENNHPFTGTTVVYEGGDMESTLKNWTANVQEADGSRPAGVFLTLISVGDDGSEVEIGRKTYS